MSGESKLARPYAKAVFELAKDQQSFSQWSEILRVAKEIAEHPRVIAMIKNPTTSPEKIISFFMEIGGELFDEKVHRYLQLLAANKRLLIIPEIFELYELLRKEAQQIVDVELTAAMPISEDLEQKISQAIAKKMQKQVQMHCKTDPTILGGAIIRAGDWVVDGSVRGRLAKLCDAIGIS